MSWSPWLAEVDADKLILMANAIANPLTAIRGISFGEGANSGWARQRSCRENFIVTATAHFGGSFTSFHYTSLHCYCFCVHCVQSSWGRCSCRCVWCQPTLCLCLSATYYRGASFARILSHESKPSQCRLDPLRIAIRKPACKKQLRLHTHIHTNTYTFIMRPAAFSFNDVHLCFSPFPAI